MKVKRDKFIHMRLTEKEHAELESMSQEAGCTKTEFVCAFIRFCYDTVLWPDIVKIVDDYKKEKAEAEE